MTRFEFWRRWLLVAIAGVGLFGLAMVAVPQSDAVFAWLTQGSAEFPFGEAADGYLRLAHAVIGAVIVGWSLMMLILVAGPLREGHRWVIGVLGASLGAWYVLDTVVSLATGYWQNAVLNTGILAVVLPGLVGTARHRQDTKRP